MVSRCLSCDVRATAPVHRDHPIHAPTHQDIDGIDYLIHMEADGTGDMLIFAGDWEEEHNIAAKNLDHLRARMFAKHAEIMERD